MNADQLERCDALADLYDITLAPTMATPSTTTGQNPQPTVSAGGGTVTAPISTNTNLSTPKAPTSTPPTSAATMYMPDAVVFLPTIMLLVLKIANDDIIVIW